MSSSPATVFEAISAYLLEVSIRALVTARNDVIILRFPLLQAPTYHVALEAVLVTCILYLICSKSYRPESKHDKLTKEVRL